eukprot:TRINITY_DN20516_c0_g1_i1.p1 TRINITY_DN20516_c0_g1~~TRINITY_DN20516_c0_g1_i1.p1  ORF type:complete len:167 (-),score=9.33 TRINITY_DN20516_c0_g1_i1:437-937(-)
MGSPAQSSAQHPSQKMDTKLVFSFALLVLCCLIGTGTSISCYHCTTYEDGNCADPFYHYPEYEKKPKSPELLKFCPADTDETRHVCRKVYEYANGAAHVNRSCGPGTGTERPLGVDIMTMLFSVIVKKMGVTLGLCTKYQYLACCLQWCLAYLGSVGLPPGTPESK